MAAIVAASLTLTTEEGAAVIYDGGTPSYSSSYIADTSALYPEAAESFALTTGTNTITNIHWRGGYSALVIMNCCPTGDFVVSFYADNSGTPGALIFSYAVGNANQTLTGHPLDRSFSEYSYSGTIPDLKPTPGIPYWVSLSNSAGGQGWVWAGSTIDLEGGNHAQFLFGTGWISELQNLAFYLTSPIVAVVPEPASLAPLGSSLRGFAVATRHKRRARCFPKPRRRA